MTYIVNDSCIKCKYMDCVEVCPVDCFYEGENMLVIHPEECIDCGVCEPECPVEAIKPDTEPRVREMVGPQRGIREYMAEHQSDRSTAGGRQAVGGRVEQVRQILFAEARCRGLMRPDGWIY